MERHFEKELGQLNKKIIEMGSKAEEMIRLAIQALVERNMDLAARLPGLEQEVNHMQLDVDERALRLLATQQPMAIDLRFLVTAIKINSELERIGDQAVNIYESTQILLQRPTLKPLLDLPMMAEIAQAMLRESLDAFIKRDPLQAEAVIMEDDRVDAFKDQIFREVLTYMMSDPSTIQRAITLILISRNLERIGDQAVNIAEDVIYMVAGRDVRHPAKGKEVGGPATGNGGLGSV
jgi:phosphate transport system protein